MCGFVAVACESRYIPCFNAPARDIVWPITSEMTHGGQMLTLGRLQVHRRLSSFVQRHQRRKLAIAIQRWANTAWRAHDESSRATRMISRIRQAQLRGCLRTWAAASSTQQVESSNTSSTHARILLASICLRIIMRCRKRLRENSWSMCRPRCAHGNVQHCSRANVWCAS